MNIKQNNDKTTYYFFILYDSISIILIFAAHFLSPSLFGFRCLFKLIFKIPCPTCGTYRVLYHLSQFNYAEAFLSNPIMFLVIIVINLLMIFSIIAILLKLPKYDIILSPDEKKLLLLAIISLIIANWIYLLAADI